MAQQPAVLLTSADKPFKGVISSRSLRLRGLPAFTSFSFCYQLPHLHLRNHLFPNLCKPHGTVHQGFFSLPWSRDSLIRPSPGIWNFDWSDTKTEKRPSLIHPISLSLIPGPPTPQTLSSPCHFEPDYSFLRFCGLPNNLLKLSVFKHWQIMQCDKRKHILMVSQK